MSISKMFSRLLIVVAMVAALLPAMALVEGEECNAEPGVEVNTIEYIPADGRFAKDGRYTLPEGIYGGKEDGWFRYHVASGEGDKLIINNGTDKEKTYISKEFHEDEFGYYYYKFVDQNDEEDWIKDDQLHFSSNQSEKNPWTRETTDAAVTIEYEGVTCTVPVSIIENPVKTIDYIPVDSEFAKNGRYLLLEGVDGYETDEGYFDYGCLDPNDFDDYVYYQIGDKLIINKGTSEEKTYIISSRRVVGIDDNISSYPLFVNQDNDCDKFSDQWIHVSSDQSKVNPWTPKTKNAAFVFEYWGVKCSVPVKIIMDPYSIANATVTGLKTKVYTGKVIKQTPVVKLAGKTLKLNRDYTVTYKNNKAVGKATVTIKGKGYRGQISKKFTIKPKGTSLSKVKAIRKGFTVKWKKQARQTTGYQIQYSTSKKFKSGTKIVTIKKNKTVYKKIKKLKGKKTYYVRVRTYKKVGSSTYYSSWSKSKRVKTR